MAEMSLNNARGRGRSGQPGKQARPAVDDRKRIAGSAFPASGAIPERLRFMLDFAVLAPSSHNTQPWRFVVQENSVLLCADRTRALPVIDPQDRELTISCGAALLNLRVALAHFGQRYRIAMFPYSADPDILAEISLDPAGFADPSLGTLFDAMLARVTDRGRYSALTMPARLRGDLMRCAEEEGASLTLIREKEQKLKVAELVAEGDRLQFANPAFRRELAAWIHGSRSEDGMPAYSQGAGELLNRLTPLVSAAIRTFDMGGRVAATHEELAAGAPHLLILSTPRDDAESWLCAGQALERVLLLAAQVGFSASYLNQPIETRSLRSGLRAMAGTEKYPQILLRLGKRNGPMPPPSPRRPLAEVLG